MATTILLVRHGQTEWNRNERFRGRYDVELNAHGLEQAQKTAERIAKSWKPAVVYSSPLKRALRTAAAIAQQFTLDVIPSSGLIDIDYGAWQGLIPAEASSQWPEQYDTWLNHPEKAKIPGGEPLAAVRERAMSFLAEIAETHNGQTIALVSHTVVNRVILLSILGAGIAGFWWLGQDPCAINVIKFEQPNFMVQSVNDTCHLI
jgi:broad specificity phosphatase PhoE